MANFGLPSITIAFKSIGITAIERSQRGIIAMILRETKATASTPAANNAETGTGATTNTTPTTDNSALFSGSPYIIYDETDIPAGLSTDNQEQIKLALIGYQTAPKHILVFIKDKTETDYNDILILLENAHWDYLVIPEIASADVQTIAAWIKAMRTTKDKKVKAVLPNCAADCEGVINFTNTKIVTVTKTYTTAQYCSRIAGIICGTPMTISCTFAPLSEVIDCDKYTKDQMDTKVGNGELFIMFDGTKYKIARSVNSFVTTIENKGDKFKKIKLIDLMDMIHDDIKDTANDSYIGKYANSYDNKCLLISAIQGYYMQLELEGLLEKGQNTCALDLDATTAWILSNGKATKAAVTTMKTQDIKEFNTQDNVFLASGISMLDAIENIALNIAI
ncbi:phage tail sheath subtilisin-like domain-containing protein [Pectinatus frisingensis]|uniref:phage tail sheath subtilisin-like domain-containing protein n=1 Tax=Pectinatus frisingensis TaxID=865 RepID=UPI0018C80930|nr:phage tail sheath subtilisin-like domain-containing protein [Pectinatus frisingensis]